MMFKEISLAVSIFIPIVGFVFTNFNLKKQFKSELEKTTNLERRTIYYEAYDKLGKFRKNCFNLYCKSYIEELQKIEVRISLFGNAEVAKIYKDIVDEFNKISAEYHNRISEEGFDKIFIDDDYKEYKCQPEYPDPHSELFDEKIMEYKNRHLPDVKKIEQQISNLLKMMKVNIGIND